jgi:cellulose synthase/poly-beta-1,6-N-acetylglucosamine synthase-like glycosyltransferase
MPTAVLLLLTVQATLLAAFTVFAFFNYLYAAASLWRPTIARTQHSGRRIAVVIASFNEKYVLDETIRACDALTYPNKQLVVVDDSTDPAVVESLRRMAIARGCREVRDHGFVQEITVRGGTVHRPIEIWRSEDFVLFHRTANVGFKAGGLRKVQQYLEGERIELMYVIDADWHPQPDALERTLEVLEADDTVAFVQAKRLSSLRGMNLFQRYVALLEEACYYVDFEGRQVLNHPILFSGCCALFRVDAIAAVGGFTPGHLTEDLDLTDRLWLQGWRGVYLGDVVNYGEVPFTYDHYRRQQERWAAGSARAFRDFAWQIVRSTRLDWFAKAAAIRQNAYYTTTLLTGVAIALGMSTVGWVVLAHDSYAVEYYLYVIGVVRVPYVALLYWCILSNLVEPLLMVSIKKRDWRGVIHLPMMVWYAWSVVPTYIIGNIKGLLRLDLDWFLTPKFSRTDARVLDTMPFTVRAFNLAACVALLAFYFLEGFYFGWSDDFALLFIPAFLLATINRSR